MKFKALFCIVSQVSVLLPIIAGWVYYKNLTYPFRILFYFFLLCIGFEIQATVAKNIYNNNMPGLHLFSIVQFLFFSTIYYYGFERSNIVRRVIFFNGIVAFIIAVIDAIFIDGITHTNTISRSYTGICMVIYTLIYLYQLFDTHHDNRYAPMFWLTIAALVYFANNFLYFTIRRYLLINARTLETIPYYLYLSFNIIAHFLYAQSFRCFRKWKMESSSTTL